MLPGAGTSPEEQWGRVATGFRSAQRDCCDEGERPVIAWGALCRRMDGGVE